VQNNCVCPSLGEKSEYDYIRNYKHLTDSLFGIVGLDYFHDRLASWCCMEEKKQGLRQYSECVVVEPISNLLKPTWALFGTHRILNVFWPILETASSPLK